MYKMKQMKVAVSPSVVTSASVDFVDVADHSGQFYSLHTPLVLFTANNSSRHLVTTSLCVQ